MKALIIHTRRTGLGLIRSLGKKEVDVFCADEYKSPGFYSRYVSEGFIIPSIIKDGERSFYKPGKTGCIDLYVNSYFKNS